MGDPRKLEELLSYFEQVQEDGGVAGLDLNPRSWAAAAAEGVFDKARGDFSDEARKVEKAAHDFQKPQRKRQRQGFRTVVITDKTPPPPPPPKPDFWESVGEVWDNIPGAVKVGAGALLGIVILRRR
jgi:hypothetical protein